MFDITIIGAGLTGLTAGISLSKAGMKVAIIEKKDLSQLKHSTRAITLSAGTVTFYKKIGIDIPIDQAGKIEKIFITDHDGFGVTTFDAEEIGQKHMGYVVNNEEIINLMIQNIGNIELFDKNTNYDIQKLDNGFKIMLNNVTLISKIIIIAEGSKSNISNFGFTKKTINYNQKALMFNIRHQNSHKNIATEHFTPNGPFATLPLLDSYQSNVIWTQSASLNSVFNEKTLQNDMLEYLPKWLGEVTVQTPVLQFPLSINVANTYYKENIFLLGATARNLHPLAGQAFNVTVQDIEILTECLDNWYVNGAQAEKIYKYALKWRAKRILPGFSMSCFTHLTNVVFSNNSSILKLTRNGCLMALDMTRALKGFLIGHSSGR